MELREGAEIYPVLIDGEEAGTLTVERQGPAAVFSADCDLREGLVRLSVYGGGQEGYLGLLVPEDGRLRLRKKLSRAALRDFPGEIERVERAGLMPDPVPEPPPVETRNTAAPGPRPDPASDKMPEDPQASSGTAPEDGKAAHAAVSPEPPVPGVKPEKSAARSEADPKAGEAGEGASPDGGQDLSWYASPDGALVCFDGTSAWIALPPEDERNPARVRGTPRTIDGREYLVYRTRSGRIVRE